mmetsp:Transcript_20137/g.64887  ORF Transcript_20137/g.64887 Transcript_20137/m.64887 type:complete len:220 (+) Transcript_20137:779-1438(+)
MRSGVIQLPPSKKTFWPLTRNARPPVRLSMYASAVRTPTRNSSEWDSAPPIRACTVALSSDGPKPPALCGHQSGTSVAFSGSRTSRELCPPSTMLCRSSPRVAARPATDSRRTALSSTTTDLAAWFSSVSTMSSAARSARAPQPSQPAQPHDNARVRSAASSMVTLPVTSSWTPPKKPVERSGMGRAQSQPSITCAVTSCARAWSPPCPHAPLPHSVPP